jgi:hypothetical protein
MVGLPSVGESVPVIDDADDLEVTELVVILPFDTETYHLQLRAGTVLTVNLQSEDVFEMRLLEEEAWLAAGSVEARRTAPCCFSVPFARNTVIEFTAPHSGDFLLLMWNDSEEPASALIALSSRRPDFTPPQGRPESMVALELSRPIVWWTATQLAAHRIGSRLRTMLDRK